MHSMKGVSGAACVKVVDSVAAIGTTIASLLFLVVSVRALAPPSQPGLAALFAVFAGLGISLVLVVLSLHPPRHKAWMIWTARMILFFWTLPALCLAIFSLVLTSGAI